MTAPVPPVGPASDLPASRFVWDERIARFRDARGRLVREADVRAALDRTIAAADDRLGALADALRSRTIPVREWERRMREVVKDAHLRATMAGRGGVLQLTAADYGRVGAECRRQYALLRRFRRAIEQGEQPLDGRFLRRMRMYADAARRTYHDVEAREKVRRGYGEYRNVLGAADHCGGCLAATARGWVPVGTLPPIGSRTCLASCRCSFAYRKGEETAQADGG